MAQMLLLPDPRPLDRRLGIKFFRKAPRRPGVYLMRNAQDEIVYVGKAKDLKQRLNNYRTANPDRMPRRHLKMVNEVSRIEFQLCRTEAAALKHEKKLIRELKPKFNRAGVWQGRPQFLAWRFETSAIEFQIHETPHTGWQRFGSLGSYAPRLRLSLVRLLWLALNPNRGFYELPHGWTNMRLVNIAAIVCNERGDEVRAMLEQAFWGRHELFLNWLAMNLNVIRPPFDQSAIARDTEELKEFFKKHRSDEAAPGQIALI
jgi:predicted GIY-YIG superfamily endonuclease